MHGEHHVLISDFPELRDTIHELKVSDDEFARLMDQYNELTKRIEGLEARDEPVADAFMEDLKRQRVHLKDTLYERLRAATAEHSR